MSKCTALFCFLRANVLFFFSVSGGYLGTSFFFFFESRCCWWFPSSLVFSFISVFPFVFVHGHVSFFLRAYACFSAVFFFCFFLCMCMCVCFHVSRKRNPSFFFLAFAPRRHLSTCLYLSLSVSCSLFLFVLFLLFFFSWLFRVLFFSSCESVFVSSCFFFSSLLDS